MTTKTIKFECPKLSGSLLISPYAVHSASGVNTGATMTAEDFGPSVVVDLDRASTVSAARDAERAVAPHMKVSKP